MATKGMTLISSVIHALANHRQHYGQTDNSIIMLT